MNVVYHSSDQFAPVLGVSIASLLENNRSADSIDIYVIEHAISPENKARLTNLAKGFQRTLHFIPMHDINKVENLNLKRINNNWIFDSFCRLFLDHLLPPNIDRVLYLDSDVLVVGDLLELWNHDMNGKCISAVKDCIGKKYFDLFELSSDDAYCNSGVILIDLNLWRQKLYDKKITDYVQAQNGYVFFMEQTVMNVVFKGDIEVLPPRYNVTTQIMTMDYSELNTLRRPTNWYSQEEIAESLKNPAIIHMTSFWLVKSRAWYNKSDHPAHDEYLKYMKLTEWKDEKILDEAGSWKDNLFSALIRITPRKILLRLMSFVYNNIRIWKIRHDIKNITANNEREQLVAESK